MTLPQRLPYLHRHRGRAVTEGGRAAEPEARLGAVLVAAAACVFMVQLDFFALSLALPRMSSDLGVSVHDLQWALSGYMLAIAALLIPGGRVGDLLGRRTVLVGGVILFAVSSAICALAASAELIIGFRILQGMGWSAGAGSS